MAPDPPPPPAELVGAAGRAGLGADGDGAGDGAVVSADDVPAEREAPAPRRRVRPSADIKQAAEWGGSCGKEQLIGLMQADI